MAAFGPALPFLILGGLAVAGGMYYLGRDDEEGEETSSGLPPNLITNEAQAHTVQEQVSQKGTVLVVYRDNAPAWLWGLMVETAKANPSTWYVYSKEGQGAGTSMPCPDDALFVVGAQGPQTPNQQAPTSYLSVCATAATTHDETVQALAETTQWLS